MININVHAQYLCVWTYLYPSTYTYNVLTILLRKFTLATMDNKNPVPTWTPAQIVSCSMVFLKPRQRRYASNSAGANNKMFILMETARLVKQLIIFKFPL